MRFMVLVPGSTTLGLPEPDRHGHECLGAPMPARPRMRVSTRTSRRTCSSPNSRANGGPPTSLKQSPAAEVSLVETTRPGARLHLAARTRLARREPTPRDGSS
jgi:hypothetical protein